MSSENEAWEYGALYFLNTMTATGAYGPHLAIVEDGTGLRLLPFEGKINTMNFLGGDGWIIDGFHYSGSANNAPVAITELVTSVDGADRIGDYSVQSMRRRVP